MANIHCDGLCHFLSCFTGELFDLGACELIAQRSVEPEQSSTGNPPTLSDTRFCAISLRVTCFACVTCFRKLFQGPGRHEAAGSCRRSPLLPRAASTTKHTVSLLLLRGSKRALAGTGIRNVCAVLRPPILFV